MVDSEMLAAALLEQSTNGRRLGEILVEQGLLSDDDLARALAEQFGMEQVDLRRTMPAPDALALIPESTVRMLRAMPIAFADGVLTVAVAGAPDEKAMQQLRDAAGGVQLRFAIASSTAIDRAIDRSYDALSGLDRFVTNLADAEPDVADQQVTTLTFDDSAPVVQVVQRIITQAVRERASDIHVEPQDTVLRVRFRVDGALHDVVDLPVALAQSLVSRIKIMADMNIVERRR
jgi:type IV pilus assembly protein PilB